MNVKEECASSAPRALRSLWGLGEVSLSHVRSTPSQELWSPPLLASSRTSLQWVSLLHLHLQFLPHHYITPLSIKYILIAPIFFKKENFPWLCPHSASALYSKTLKEWLTLTFHSPFDYSNHLSSPSHPWNNSYQGPSAIPNAMGITLSSCNLTSYCILTQLFTFTFRIIFPLSTHGSS